MPLQKKAQNKMKVTVARRYNTVLCQGMGKAKEKERANIGLAHLLDQLLRQVMSLKVQAQSARQG